MGTQGEGPDLAALVAEERRRVVRRECPFCGTFDAWSIAEDVSVIYYAGELLTTGQLGAGVGFVPFACGECGYTRFHALKALERSSEGH
jgi:ribosomal protein S27AE